MALAWIHRNILSRLQQLCNRYLWAGNQDKNVFAWISWQKIAKPKKWRGWGLKDLPLFVQALAAKMGWTLLTSQNLWTHISYQKYIWPQHLMDWVRMPSWPRIGISTVWKALIHSLPHIRDNLVWRINDGSLDQIGMDPWIGSGGRHLLSQDLIAHLHSHEMRVFSHIVDQQNTGIFAQACKSACLLGLPPRWHLEWHECISVLSKSHIRIKEGPDELEWCLAENGIYSPKFGYISLNIHKGPDKIINWWRNIWKLSAPSQTKLFFWCILRDKVPMGEHLTHRAFHGPTWCFLCKWKWEGNDLGSAWEEWTNRHKGSNLQNLPLLVSWYIWKARNRLIFDNRPAHWPHIEANIISAFKELPDPPPPKERHTHPPPCIDKNTPWAFSDGAANQQGCGGGFILYISEQHFYKVKMGLGAGTNNYGELITLRHLLHFSLGHQCNILNIFWDSKIIINWFNGIASCHIHTLSNILNEVNIFKAEFNNISCTHIYREHNGDADKLSEAALLPRGEWVIIE
eukprot:PITA_20420